VPGGLADLPPGVLEALRSSVIGIGDVLTREARYLVQQQRPSRRRAGRRDAFEVCEIRGVQRDDAVEIVKVLRLHLPGAVGADVDAMAHRFGAGTRVGSLADMPRAGAGRIDHEVETGRLGFAPQGGFGERRPADVAEADEEDGGTVRHHPPIAGRTVRVTQ
jgi:hypothetical protein